jgi:quercetin dioxygenase-like cupin family protein
MLKTQVLATSIIFFVAAGGGWVCGQGLSAPAFSGNKVTPLVMHDLSNVANKQVIANVYEVPVGSTVPRHTHHGDEFHFVLSGEWAAEVEDREMKILKAGESQYVPSGKWHGGKVIGDVPLRLLGVMIVDKDKPITQLLP